MSRAERTSGRRRATPPTLVVLVRHGATETTGKVLPGRAPGLHLSDKGREQADTAAARVAALVARSSGAADGKSSGKDGKEAGKAKSNGDAPKVALYASPLERTSETAAPIGAALGVEVVPDEGLLELDMGDWTGLDLTAARKR